MVEDIAPDAVEVLINAITNPGAAVGSGVRVAVKAFRKAFKFNIIFCFPAHDSKKVDAKV